jgi:hypothetical protein
MSFSAIICASRPASDSPAILRANLRFAGQTLLEYQVRQAAEAGAGQVMILVAAVTQPLSQAMDRLTADGIKVTIVRDMVSLMREVPRDQDMLVVADGVIVPQHYYTLMGGEHGAAILVVDDNAASANFERVDAGQRWAGLARVTPDVLFGTLDMIGDWDLELTLMRAVVQARAHRVLVSHDEVIEARLALIHRQAEADLVAQALLMRPSGGTGAGPDGDVGAERYVLEPLAAHFAPMLLRSQVPAGQVRGGALGTASIGIIAALLHWPMVALLLFLVAIVLALTVDRLVRLARRGGKDGWSALLPQEIVIAGIGLIANDAGHGMEGLYLAGLLGILLVGQHQGRFGVVRKWAMFTPGTAILLLLLTTGGGYFGFGLSLSVLCAILSLGVAVIGRKGQG